MINEKKHGGNIMCLHSNYGRRGGCTYNPFAKNTESVINAARQAADLINAHRVF